VWQDVRAGFLYMWKWPGMFAMLIMATLINMVYNPAFSLMPILVTRHFGLGVLELGWINSAWGFGIIAGGLTLSAWGGFKKRLYTSMLGLVGMGVGTLLIGLAPANAFWLALGGMVLTGFMNPITNGPVFAMLQDIVDPEVQGRVFTVLMSVSAAASPLGMAVAGPVSDAVGVQVWFLVGGVMSMLMAVAALSIPAIAHLEEAGHARREQVVA
jgi:MFS transporter, DHA3 family, macrolide efflux protein